MSLNKLKQILREHPDVAERTAQFLAGEPTTAEMERLMERTNLHLPESLLEEAEALVPRLAKVREYRSIRLSRAMVLRLAIERGLEVLRQQADEAEAQGGGDA
jgi:hypothetical protein